jgi:hypothetical protein
MGGATRARDSHILRRSRLVLVRKRPGWARPPSPPWRALVQDGDPLPSSPFGASGGDPLPSPPFGVSRVAPLAVTPRPIQGRRPLVALGPPRGGGLGLPLTHLVGPAGRRLCQ